MSHWFKEEDFEKRLPFPKSRSQIGRSVYMIGMEQMHIMSCRNSGNSCLP